MNPQADREEAIRKLAELIGKIRIAMLTTVTEQGTLWSRPITTQKALFDGDLWFITRLESPKVQEMRQNRQVSLSYVMPQENVYVSVSGTAQLVSDPAKIQELWDPSYQRWFPGGLTDPHFALIRVSVEQAEYWEAPPWSWPTEAGFIVLAPEQRDNPEFHARIVMKKD